jgi:23S rRNA (uracil1939-C5)-methyltransferase
MLLTGKNFYGLGPNPLRLVSLMARSASRRTVPLGPEESLLITSVDLEAKGVAHRDGKVVFVEGALPGERVTVQVTRSKASFDVAKLISVQTESTLRVKPRCPSFGICGGCSMQHIDAAAQVSLKQRVLEDTLWHLGRVRPATVLRPIAGPAWGYRYRARLSVRDVLKKGEVLVGFHEKNSSFVADMQECHVLPASISALLPQLRELIKQLSIRRAVPQIELAIGDTATALVFRVMQAPSEQDLQLLQEFEAAHGLELWLQTKGPETMARLDGKPSDLAYLLPQFNLRMAFKPSDFTQVNHQINAVLVGQALAALRVTAQHRVLDLFCGLGNFTLPLARLARDVVGIEGSKQLTLRAGQAARDNGLADKATFETENLFDFTLERWNALQAGGRDFDRLLIDPPREGAMEVAKVLALAPKKVARIVYVSCNPATLARDAGILCNEGGYRLEAAGVVNMFPHTAHVESMAIFVPQDNDYNSGLISQTLTQ